MFQKMVKVNPIYKEYLQPISTPIIVLNTSRQIESINDQATHLLHLKENDVLQLDKSSQVVWDRLIKQLSQDEYYHCVLNVILKDQIEKFNFVCHFDRKNSLIYARIKRHTKYNMNVNKKFAQVYSMFKDFPNGLLISELDGVIIDLNDNSTIMLGLDKCQLMNKPHEQMFSQFNDTHLQLQYFWELSCNGQATIELSRTENDSIRWYKFESKINITHKLIYTTITDETEKYQLKQELDHQNSLKLLGQLAATIAHEIRNPMTSIKGFLELVKLNSTEENMKYLNIMKSELVRMEEILAEVLDLSKPVERKFDSISIPKIVMEVEEIMKPLAAIHQIVIQVKVPKTHSAETLGNANRIKQMLINLVKNAVEEMHHGGTITISVRMVNGKIQLAVSDEGKGIEKDKLARLFTPFYTTKSDGTGLGLQFVKQVMEEHNGSIRVNSKVNEGSTFVAEFPCLKESSQQLWEKRSI